MNKDDYIEITKSIIRTMEHIKYIETTVGELSVSTDVSDIGNEVGFAVGEHIVKLGLDKDDFIIGIKHGLSLTDGTHK